MRNTEATAKPVLGFLTVVEHAQFGLFGGYLVLNLGGRPVEFHCTAPVKPNRAQEILYGPTLQSFLYGEQIGKSLIEQASATPLVICTDLEPALAAREYISSPVALVLPGQVDAGSDMPNSDQPSIESIPEIGNRTWRVDRPHRGPKLATFTVGRNRLAIPERADDDRRLILERLASLDEAFDLAEPFGRIRDAIDEARQAVR
jgi:hypothetical protein